MGSKACGGHVACLCSLTKQQTRQHVSRQNVVAPDKTAFLVIIKFFFQQKQKSVKF
jgi:hypothetical protein